MNHLGGARLKEIVNLQDIIKTDELHFEAKRRKVYNFNEYFIAYCFLRDKHEGHISLEDAHDKQSNFDANLKKLDKGKKQLKKSFF